MACDVVEEVTGDDIAGALEEGRRATDQGRLVVVEFAIEDLDRGGLGIDRSTDESAVASEGTVENIRSGASIHGQCTTGSLRIVVVEGAAIEDDGSDVVEVCASTLQATVIVEVDSCEIESDAIDSMDSCAQLCIVELKDAIDDGG